MKVCTQCKEEKGSNEFPRRLKNKDGLYSWCKLCCRDKVKKYREENPEKVKASKDKRKDNALEKAREYKEKNKEKLKKKQKVYYLANEEVLKAKARQYGKNATEEQKKNRVKYYHEWKSTESAKKYRKLYREKTKDKYAKHRKATRTVTNAIRDGRMIRPDFCSYCKSTQNIEGHHPDYEKPLEVIWLCRKCHRALHKELKNRKE